MGFVRIACLLVPDLPLQAEIRANPESQAAPLVITSGPGQRAEILATSRSAAAQGVRPGQTLPQARAVCPSIEVRSASPVLERTAREALLDVALSLSPRAELAPRASGLFASEAAVFVDANGIEALHGNSSGSAETSFASILHARTERAGMRGFLALAPSRATARLAARDLALSVLRSPSPRESDEKTRILPPGRELDFLAPLSVDLLDPDDRTAQALTRFGVHRIRDLLQLPRRDLAARLGPGLLSLVARARGEEREPPIPEPHTTALEEGQDLETSIAHLEALAFVLRGLISRLTERLELRGLGCTELQLTLMLDDGTRRSRRIRVASPCQEGRVLLRLLRLAVEREPPTAPIEGVLLRCEGVALQREQLDLFLPRGPSPSALDQTLAELESICGEGRVGAPQVADDPRPDAFDLKPFRREKSGARAHLPPTPHRAPPLRRQGPRLTVRALRPPLRAEVRIVQGRPVHLRSPVTRGTVLRAAGPWRTTGYWWAESTRFAIDHYDVQMSDGTLLRLCFDWVTRRWQIDGLYD